MRNICAIRIDVLVRFIAKPIPIFNLFALIIPTLNFVINCCKAYTEPFGNDRFVYFCCAFL